MLSVLVCHDFRSGRTGVAHPSATQCFRAALAGNCCKTSLGISLYTVSPFLSQFPLGVDGRRAFPAQLNVFASHVREIVLQDLSSISLYAVSSLLFPFPLGVDGRRAFKRTSIFPRRTCGELRCKTSLGSLYIPSVLCCLHFRSGWTGVAHSSATQFFPRRTCRELLRKTSL